MKIGERLMNIFNFNYDDDYEDDYEENYDDDYEESKSYKRESERKSSSKQTTSERTRISDDTPSSKTRTTRSQRTQTSKVVPIKSGKSSYNNGMSVQVIKPMKFEECREIVDILLRGKSVILNVEGMNVDVSQRIIDFASGAAYSIQGNLQKITNYIIIITPYGVDLSGDFNDLLNSGLDSASYSSNF